MNIRPLSARDRFVAEPAKRPSARREDEPPDEVAFMLPTTPPRDAPRDPSLEAAGPAAVGAPRSSDAAVQPRVPGQGGLAPADPHAPREVKQLDDAATLTEVPALDVDADIAPDADAAAAPADPDVTTLDAAALARAVRAAQVAAAGAAQAPDTTTLATLGLMAVDAEALAADGQTEPDADAPELDGPGELGDLASGDAFDLARLGLDRAPGARAPERVLAPDAGRPIADQVADAVKKLAADAAGDGVIRVRGGEAGDFAAYVRQDGLQLSLRLVAEGHAQRGALEARLPELRQALVRAGYQPESLDVTTSDRHAPRRDARPGRPDRDADDGVEFVL